MDSKSISILGHSYLHQVIMNSQRQSIGYLLEDRNTKQTERFDLSLLKKREEFVFEGQNHFMGIEWWCNKMGNFSYPIRYHIEVSQLMYGIDDNKPSDFESILYRPYNVLVPNEEGSSRQHLISFHNTRIKDDCICYDIKSDSCRKSGGMKYLSKMT